ncbi:MAG: peptidylprolyl isomerase [Pseudomonadota bacterium]|nr:peptidylprolyl isomerase [Pseudomonadota bacterium]
MMKTLSIVILLALASVPASAAEPANMDIAAVVGGDAISSYDVNNRLHFAIVTAHLSNTPDVIQHIRPQVVHGLIDEKLELQEAAKNDIKVTDDDIAQAIAAIESQRGMPPGTIYNILDSNHIPRETFQQQIRAQLSWNKLLIKTIRPHVRVSDDEIKLASQRIAALPARPAHAPEELRIGVITLPVDKPGREKEVARLSEKLMHEVRSGASFEEVARQFSSARADTFWVKPQQLDPRIAQALASADKGAITNPIRTDEGYTIVKVYDSRGADTAERDTRDMEVTLKEILLKLKPDAGDKEADALLQIGEEVAKHPGSCEDKGVANIENLEEVNIDVDFQHSRLSELPSGVRSIVENLNPGEISTPFASDEGLRLYMLCDKKEAGNTPDRERVYNLLIQQKMELEAQKYLRNLRREVFIEIRGEK